MDGGELKSSRHLNVWQKCYPTFNNRQWLLVEIWEENFQWGLFIASNYDGHSVKWSYDNTWNNIGVCYSSSRVQVWTRRITALLFRIIAIKNLSEIVEDQREISLVVAPVIRASTNDTQPMQVESSLIKKSDSKTDMVEDKIELENRMKEHPRPPTIDETRRKKKDWVGKPDTTSHFLTSNFFKFKIACYIE